MTMKKVNVKEYGEICEYIMKTGSRGYVEGKAGIGKSTVPHLIAKRLGLELVDWRASTMDVGDGFMRMPNKDGTAMVELVNSTLVKDKPFVLLLDEFRHADPTIRRMFYQLIWDKALGSYKLPKGTSIIAISNPTDEVDTEDLEAPLFDRFDFKVEVEFNQSEWEEWAHANAIKPEVITFLHHFNRYLHTNVDGIPITPRTWERVSNHMEQMAYALPEEVSIVFKEFIKKMDFFKNIDDYMKGKREVPEELDMQYAFASAMLSKVSNKMTDPVMDAWFNDRKVKGLHEEVSVFLNAGLIKTHQAQVKAESANKYILALPKELRNAIVKQYAEVGYIFDAKV